MSKSITMEFSTDGKCKIEANGYTGQTCIDATAPFENLFSDTVKPREASGECAPNQGERVRT